MNADHTALTLTVKNEKTVVSVAKRNDIEDNTKTSSQKSLNGEVLSGAKLEIYEVDEAGNRTKKVTEWTSGTGEHRLTDGMLKENTIYVLHEEEAPVGYLAADDIFFKLFGTTQRGDEVVSQLYVWTGSGAATLDGTSWSKTTSINKTVLTMVDEAIIAPVDLQKVVGSETAGYEILPGAVFKVESLDDGTVLGTAVTDSTGHLVWKTVVTPNGLVFNANGKRAESDSDVVLGKAIILRQNSNGYNFTEISAPDKAYCDESKSYTVKITAGNYQAYRDGGYRDDVYVDILAANAAESKTVQELTTREDIPTADDLVNPPFEASFQLYKYDAENPAINDAHNNYETIGLEGVTFTLYKMKADGTYPQTGTTYTTGENGLLHIELAEKGTYKLVETTPLTGYQKNSSELVFTIVNSDYKKTLTYSEEGMYHTLVIRDENENPVDGTAAYDLPNSRIHGTVTLTKQDADSGVKLNGVQYTLTRIDPSTANLNVDKWFPGVQASVTVETGKTYQVVAGAENAAAFDSGRTDGTTGVLTIQDLQWGNYQLVERTAADGYILDTAKILKVTVGPEGLTKTVTDDGKQFVTNTKNSLTVKKTALDGTTVLDNAQFVLHPVTKNGETETMDNSRVRFFSTANAQTADGVIITAGKTTIYGLPLGTYVLEEIKAPDGYELTEKVYFTMQEDGTVAGVTTCRVGENGTVTRVDTGNSVVTASVTGSGINVNYTLTVKDTPIEVSLTKALQGSVAINNRGDAAYEIKGIFAGETGETTKKFTGNSITDELKAMLIGGNSYTITEIHAPDGYEVQKNAATILVREDGTIVVTGGKDFLTVDNSTGTAALTFTDAPIELTLKKVDQNGSVIDEIALGYAKFSITGQFANDSGSAAVDTIEGLTTADFTDMLRGRLISGETYTVTETFAPNGYKLTNTFTFTVDPYGNLKTVSGSDASGVGSDVLTVKNYPTEITFVKVDDNGPLKDAQFTLTAENGTDDVFVKMTQTPPEGVTTWTANKICWTSTDSADGTTFTNHLIAGIRYKLHEERRPYHEVMENDIVFHLDEYGKIEVTQNSSIPNNTGDAAAISDNGIVMTIRNPIIKGTVTLTKYWKERSKAADAYNEQHLLPGAVYKLTMVKNAEGQEVNTPVKTGERTSDGYAYNETGTVDRFTTDDSGKIVITGLPEGTYEFLEVDAPPAYHINNEEADKIQFTIVNAGGARAALDPEMDARVNASISLTKYSGETLLPGAVFDVAYSETENGTYTSIGTMTTGDNGVARFPQGTYPGSTTPEGLRRGCYRLTELSADGQMLNDTESTRNTITFEIGNKLDKVYEVKAGSDYSKGGLFISLEDRGVVDTPIPTKSITVHKVWKDDSGLELTFRPESIQVQLYRSYNGGEPEAVGNSLMLNADNDWRHTWEDQPAYVNKVTGENGKMTTYLYTYTVREVDGKSWYDVQYSDSTVEGPLNVGEEDGNTTSTITNTLIGGGEKKTLTIHKTLGGGSTEDAFQVRVILKRDGEIVGNSEFGYYLDPCKVFDANDTELRTETPDANGWMTIHGGESIAVELPKGVSYEVEESTDANGDAITVNTSQYSYVPRYDSNQTGKMEDHVSTTIRNAVHKSLSLVKQDISGNKLQGAEFTVTYAPLDGSRYTGQPYTKTFTTDENGKPIDLTNQGTYTIVETRAPAGYITPTNQDGTPIVLATVTVNENDIMSIVSASDLAAVDVISDGSKASVTVTNEQTKVFIGKTIDYANGTPLEDARLEIYDQDDQKLFGEWLTGADSQLVTEGLLCEGVVYRLHEVDASAPVGYLEALDVYFKLDGTYTDSNGNRSRIVLTDKDGAPVEQNTNGNSYGAPGVVNGILKLVDETIIAPVNLRKVLQTGENTWTALENVEFTVSDGTTTFGTAVTNSQGYLIWKTLNSVADSSGETLVYNAQGSKETRTGDVQSQNLPVILRQNTAGYQFRESYAPDHAYNNGRIYHVKITDGNFEKYRLTPANGAPQFDSTKYINIVEADANAETHTVENLSTRSDTTEFTSAVGLAVNLPYKSTITLFKYDADEGANNGPLPGTKFTLYHAVIGESGWTPGAVVTDAWETGKTDPQPDGVFTTGSNGELSIEIHKKGSYILVETAAAPGYKLSANPPTLEFTLIDGNDGEERQPYWYNGTEEWKLDETGIPNESIHLSLTKVDYDDSNTPLSGVTFTLEPAEDSSFIASYAENNPGRIVDGKITLTTDDQGAIKIPKGLVQQDNSYILTETDLGSKLSPGGESGGPANHVPGECGWNHDHHPGQCHVQPDAKRRSHR